MANNAGLVGLRHSRRSKQNTRSITSAGLVDENETSDGNIGCYHAISCDCPVHIQIHIDIPLGLWYNGIC